MPLSSRIRSEVTDLCQTDLILGSWFHGGVFFSERGSPEPILIRTGLFMGSSGWSFSADHLLFNRDVSSALLTTLYVLNALALQYIQGSLVVV